MKLSVLTRLVGATVLSAVILAHSSLAFAAETSAQLVNGVTFFKDTTSSGRDMRALVVDPAVVTVRPEGKTSCSGKFSSAQFTALGNEANVVGLINANFFESSTLGDYIGNQIYLGPAGSTGFFAIKTDGQFELGAGRLDPAQASQYKMFLGGIYRIDSTKPLAQMTGADINTRFGQIYSQSASNATGSIARTFLGVNVPERKLILFTGGQGNHRGQGVTPQEGIEFLKRHGATAAYNLDSGSSTLMRINSRLSASDQGGDTLGSGSLATLLVVRTDSTAPSGTLNCRGSSDTTPTTVSTDTTSSTTTTGSSPTTGAAQQVVVPVGAVPLEAPINGSTTVSSEGGVIVNYARILFTYAAGLAGTLALLMLIVSGIQIIMGGSGEAVGKAKERIIGVLSGLVILGSGGYILYLINPCFFTFGTATTCQVRSTRYENPNFQTNGVNQFVSGSAGGTAANTTRTRARSPQVYAQEKLSMIKGWWRTYNTDILRITRALAPNAAPEFFMGVASNGSLRENTTGFRTGLADERAPGTNPPLGGVATQGFHEIGWFGVEGGSRNGPAPGPSSNWSTIATSQEVRDLLGREGVTAPGSWYEAAADQLAIGIINNRNHGRNVNNGLPANIQARDENSLWFQAMTTLGWSAGDARAARIIRMVANDIANVPENQRWGALVRAFYTKGQDRSILPVQEGGVYDVYNNPFFAIIRTMQKIEAGLALARDHGGNVAYFEDGLGAERQQIHTVLTNLAFYGTPTGQ